MPEVRYYDVECVPLNSSENNVCQNNSTFIARIIVTVNGRKQYAIDNNGDMVALTDDEDEAFTRSIVHCLDVKWKLCDVNGNSFESIIPDPNNPFRVQITGNLNGKYCLSVSVYHKYKVEENYNQQDESSAPPDKKWEIERGDVLFSLAGLQLMVNAVASRTLDQMQISEIFKNVNSSHLHPYIRMLGKIPHKSDSRIKLRKPITAN